MVQILLFSKYDILFGILAALFGTVARLYDIMLKLTGYFNDAGAVPDNLIITTSNVMTTMYTLAGVFMLFRVTVSMINLLIDPDKVNDSQVGPGKLVVRIITSIAMLLIFVPNGWVFSKNPDNQGILMRIERALLAEDGLINNLIPEVNGDKANLNTSSRGGLFVDNVYATSYDCYYVYITKSSYAMSVYNNDNGTTPKSDRSITGVYHLTFYDNKTSGTTGKLCTRGIGGCKYSYTADTSAPYGKFTGKITWSGAKSDDWYTDSPYNCPNVIKDMGNKKATDGYGDAESWDKVTTRFVGGWHSVDAMKQAVQESGLIAASADATAIADFLGIDAETNFVFGVSDEAIEFARKSLASFLQCTGVADDCESAKAAMLYSKDANDKIADILAQDGMTVDFITGVVAGIGLVVWITVLCVEVIIRRFKLILLEIIAPIPIISYCDPKDETFNKWGKMYISIYLSLFLKLIAIAFAIALLQQIGDVVDGSGFLMLFYIVAILLFAKMIPDMISKVFGIDASSGSFKDIIGMGKKVLGTGAGALAGGFAGAVTGTGLGKVGGFAKGLVKGANSGRKGDITGGAKSVSATNALKRQGLNWFDRMQYQGLGALGIDPNISKRHNLEQTKQAKTQIETIQGHIKGMDDSIDRTPEVAAFNREISNGVIKDTTGNKAKLLREAFANAYDAYDSKTGARPSQLTFEDIKKTESFKKMSNTKCQEGETEEEAAARVQMANNFAKEFKADFDRLYGPDATLSISQNAWGEGYRTSKGAFLNGIKLLRNDRETVALLQNERIGGDKAKIILEDPLNMDTPYTTIASDVKGATFRPQGELNNLIAEQTQDLSFAEKKAKASK